MAQSSLTKSSTAVEADSPFGADSTRTVPMKVIVCSLSRTGTVTMQRALNILGIQTYHSYQMMQSDLGDLEQWTRLIDAKYGKGDYRKGRDKSQILNRHEFEKVLGNYMAVADLPGSLFAVELAQLYPDAKVIVLNRDPDSWFRSCRGAWPFRFSSFAFTVLGWIMYWNSKAKAIQKYMLQLHSKVWGFEWPDADAEEKAKAFFHDYYSNCRENIPADRRLGFSVQEGWEPLCRYLGVDIPTVLPPGGKERVQIPFPRYVVSGRALVPRFNLKLCRTNNAEDIHKYQNGVLVGLVKTGLTSWAGRLGVVVALAETIYLTQDYWLPAVHSISQLAVFERLLK